MTDSRLDALRDMLLEGRDPEGLRLIAEIATEQPKLSPLEKLRALRRDIFRETGQPVEFEINVSDHAAVHMLEHLQPGCAERVLREGRPYDRRRLTLADGIAVFASEHLRRRGRVADSPIGGRFTERGDRLAVTARDVEVGDMVMVAPPRLSPEGQASYDSLVRRFSTPRAACSICGATGHDSTDHDL